MRTLRGCGLAKGRGLDVEKKGRGDYSRVMSTVQEIEAAIAELPKDEFWKLTDRLIARREDEWDRQIEADAKAGRLDFLFDEADAAREAGTCRPWPADS